MPDEPPIVVSVAVSVVASGDGSGAGAVAVSGGVAEGVTGFAGVSGAGSVGPSVVSSFVDEILGPESTVAVFCALSPVSGALSVSVCGSV